MTDDIVSRLRQAWKDADEIAAVHLAQDAANEIEYLRSEMANQNYEYNKLWDKHNAVMRNRKHPLTENYIGDI